MTTKPWMRRSVVTGLAVGGFLVLGVGTAHAEDGDTSPSPAPSITRTVTTLLGTDGSPAGTASDPTAPTDRRPTHGIPVMPESNVEAEIAEPDPLPLPDPVPTEPEPEQTYTIQPVDMTTDGSAHSESTTPDADLAATTGSGPEPVADTATDTSSSPAPTAGCECNLTMGTPTLDGASAGAPGTARASAGTPATIAVPVSNTGDVTVTGLAVSGPGGAMTCGRTTLAVAASTTCTGSWAPRAGEQSAPIRAIGSTPDGEVASSALLFVTGLRAAGGGAPAPGCSCDLTSGTPTVGGKPAGGPGNATAPVGSTTTVSIPVLNSGERTVSHLSATIPEGPLTCADTELAPAESTSCSGPVRVEAGDQVVPITVAGETSDGRRTTAQGVAHVTGVPAGDDPDGSDDPDGTGDPTDGADGSGGPDGSGDGTTGSITVDGVTYPVTDGTATVDGVAYPVHDGTVTIDGVAHPVTPGDHGSGGHGTDDPDGSGNGGSGGSGNEGPLAITDPTVDGRAADAPGSLDAEAHRSAAVEFDVTNTGDVDVTGLSGQVGSGDVRCSQTELAPGETTTCRGRVVPRVGAQTTPVQVSAATADGGSTTSIRTLQLSGVAPSTGGHAGPSGAIPGGGTSGGMPGAMPGTHTGAHTGGASGGLSGGVPAHTGGSAHSGTGPSGGVIVGGVPAPDGMPGHGHPADGGFPMPEGGVEAGGGGTATELPVVGHEQDDEGNGLVWLLLLVGAGAVAAQGLRARSPR